MTPNSPTSGIETLPDFPAIDEIRRALWGVSAIRGAAVPVGAGFSRNAELPAPNSPKPPLWSDFVRAMSERIYPNGGEPSDPLRLAEEYKAALGPVALGSLIYDLVRDGEWLPGALHHKLVGLPWADILTTNWDTLLKRAAEITALLQLGRAVLVRWDLDKETTGALPGATLRGRNHPTVCPLVLAVFAQLPGFGRNNVGARPLSGPCHDLALGPAFRAHSESTASPGTSASQSFLACG